jgi:Short C-terminal domain
MQPDNRRYAWIATAIILIVVVGVVGFWLGTAVADRGQFAVMPMRGFGVRGQGFAIGGLLWGLLLVGLGVAFVALLVRASEHRAPAPPTVTPGPNEPAAPPAVTDGIDRLRDLAAMHEKGQLTDEEFTAAKRRLLGV